MSELLPLASLAGMPVHFTGIKGTGMAALAELLHNRGVLVTGSDVSERFYTDEVLTRLGIPYVEEFRAENIHPGLKLVVYSAAYDPAVNPELVRAKELGIPLLVYTEALGQVSAQCNSSGIAGVHGKTTTTAIVGTILHRLRFPASVLVGSAVASFDGFQTVSDGEEYFVAETCEYRRHFLSFVPRRIVVTSVEPDHLDYFKGFEDILEAFVQYAMKLPADGALIYCADDRGASEVARRIADLHLRADLVPYGRQAAGRFGLVALESHPGETRFQVRAFPQRWFSVRIPGDHTVLDAVAAIALTILLFEEKHGRSLSEAEVDELASALRLFAGSRRRSEIVGGAGGILFLDDYGHHPTAIRTTLAGLRSFYPGRRIIVDFMSHTYSRTEALLDDFARCFADADVVILHKIYASAREKSGRVTGRDLFERVAEHHPEVYYFEEVREALSFCESILTPGDLFVTMGAGNNWVLGHELLGRFLPAGTRA